MACRSGVVHGRPGGLDAFMTGHLNPAIRSLLIGLTLRRGGFLAGRLGVGIDVGIWARTGGERRRDDRSQDGDRTSEDRLRDPHWEVLRMD